ncbi:hypothetical protein AB7828_03815 [Tardiphaga sp. 215_C5_N2_1]|uniref:hypothetical protein n=1 Tax=Tardiphaga sp. 215_C5_N2_1 TaxID=3240774 RepID=UPI003F89D7EF
MLHDPIKPNEWQPLTDERFDALHNDYCSWISDLTDIRQRMEMLRDEARVGWTPSAEISASLDNLNTDDERFAAHDMDAARRVLDAAEADVAATKPHRTARIDRAKERIAALEKACTEGWKPTPGLKWPHPNVVIWCGLFSGFRWRHLDETERAIEFFEGRLAVEPASEAQLVAFDKRLALLRDRYRFGWRPFGNDRSASRAAEELDHWCGDGHREINGRPLRWYTYSGLPPGQWPQTAAQIEAWFAHFEEQREAPGLNISLKLGPTLLGKKGLRK